MPQRADGEWEVGMLALELLGGAAVLLGVAFVLARQLPVFDDEPDDGIDAGLPEDRPLRSTDIARLRFRIGLRGYRMADVDAALDAAEHALARLERAANPAVPARPDWTDGPTEGPLSRGRGRHVPGTPAPQEPRPVPTEGPLARGLVRPGFGAPPAEPEPAEPVKAELTQPAEAAEQPPSTVDQSLSDLEATQETGPADERT